MSTTRIALIGCGRRLRTVVRHLIKADDRVSFSGVLDPEPSSVEFALENFCPDGRVYGSLEDLAADAAVDWVMIGTPNYLHATQAMAMMKAGKHVFCEKPLATNMEDVVAMQNAWRESGATFVLGLTLRHAPLYRKLQGLLREGTIGKLISMEFNETLEFNHGGHIHSHPWRRKTALGGSHLLEKCCHDIDLALWMVGSRPAHVASFSGRNYFVPENAYLREEMRSSDQDKEPFLTWPSIGDRVDPFLGDSDVVDNQVGILEFENGVRATFHTNCCAGLPERRMLLLGTRGAIRADVLNGQIEWQRIGFSPEKEIITLGAKGGHGGGDDFLGQDLAACMSADADPKASLPEGLASAVTCFAMNHAAASRAVVDCSSYWEQLKM